MDCNSYAGFSKIYVVEDFQIHLLEMESEEKDLKIKKLEEAMRAINEARPPPPQRPADSPKFVNISTQTDRVSF